MVRLASEPDGRAGSAGRNLGYAAHQESAYPIAEGPCPNHVLSAERLSTRVASRDSPLHCEHLILPYDAPTDSPYTPSMDSDFSSPLLAAWPADVSWSARCLILIAALSELLWLDLRSSRGFHALRASVATLRPRSGPVIHGALLITRLAVRDACMLYMRPMSCLLRSAVVTRMLRRQGFNVSLVIGYQSVPLQFHAWVELDGDVVWDQLAEARHYHIIDRF